MVKKKYRLAFLGAMNPFRLVGTYLGLVIGLVVGFLTFAAFEALCEFNSCRSVRHVIPVFLVLFFTFIGWMVHSILRKIRRAWRV